MKRTIGSLDFPIWLLGDSAPERWIGILEHPFDSRHPIRHNIWTSIENEIQDRIFRASRCRLDLSEARLYIQNAVEHAAHKPLESAVDWPDSVMREVEAFRSNIDKYQPRIVISFGSFAFEFGRRAFGETNFFKYNHWTSGRLGNEFENRTKDTIKRRPTLVPLLHRSIAGGHFKKGHENFCGLNGNNYFSFAAARLANVITQSFSETDDIWVA